MAKKRIEPIEDNEPEAVENEQVEPHIYDGVNHDALGWDTTTYTSMPNDEIVTKPGGPAVVLDDADLTRVSFLLPRRVLFALVDPSHSEADVVGATERGLMYLTGYEGYSPYDATAHLTGVGQLVLNGCDVIAIRHSMLAGYRAAQNKAVDNDKTGFKRG